MTIFDGGKMTKGKGVVKMAAAAPAEVITAPVGKDGIPVKTGAVQDPAISTTWTAWDQDQINPNDFFQNEGGRTLVEQSQIMKTTDPHLSGVLMTRKLAILGLKREIQGEGPIADFVRDIFKNLKNFDWTLYEMMAAIASGFSVTEVVWDLLQIKGATRIIPVKLKPHNQDYFHFDRDWTLYVKDAKGEKTFYPDEMRKFMIFTYMGEYGSRFGCGKLQEIYWYWYFKKNSMKFWGIFTERFAAPVMIAHYPSDATAEDKIKVDTFIKNFKNSQGLQVPEGFIFDLLEATRSGSVDSYKTFMEYLDAGISKAILGQTLTTEPGRSGSYSLGQIHNLVRGDILKSDITFLETLINDSLVRWIVDFNFPGPIDDYPKWSINVDNSYDPIALAPVIKSLVDSGHNRIPLSWINKIYGIPELNEGEAVLQPSPAQTATQFFSELEREAYRKSLKQR